MANDISVNLIRSLFDYNFEDGKLIRKVARGNTKKGMVVGTKKKEGYLSVEINKKGYFCHRIIWLWVTGEWPKNQVDHINGIRDDNRFCNLRDVTNQENQFNQKLAKTNKSGYKGVHWDKVTKKWLVKVTIHVGYFIDKHEAARAYNEAALKYYGKNVRLNEVSNG